MKTEDRKEYLEGLKDGIPIGTGYFAVAFSLGIAARNAGCQCFFSSFPSARLCRRSVTIRNLNLDVFFLSCQDQLAIGENTSTHQ